MNRLDELPERFLDRLQAMSPEELNAFIDKYNDLSPIELVAARTFLAAREHCFEDLWASYRLQVIDSSRTPEELRVMKLIFYCGAVAATGFIMKEKSEEGQLLRLRSLRSELQEIFLETKQEIKKATTKPRSKRKRGLK